MTRLGRQGRFGNQMFQFAALKGIAVHRGFDFCIPGASDGRAAPHQLFDAFSLDGVTRCPPRRRLPFGGPNRVTERSHRFDEELFESCPDNADLKGYFQTEKYFVHIRDQILDDFRFHSPCEDKAPADRYVAIHVRRGDYVNKQFAHPLCSVNYYAEAMAMFPSGSTFVVFSDDLAWCREQPLFRDVLFSEGTSPYEDMYLMSRAEHNIVANSSFSWWAAWLNPHPDQIVVAPSLWFEPSYLSPEQTRDVVPDSWHRIDGW